jgi:PadR family transcriptional regulator, regulatory protein AphA
VQTIPVRTLPLTSTQAAILGLLTFGERSGYDLRKGAERSVGYLWAPAKSQIYAVLPTLVEERYATRRGVSQDTRPDKHLYRITARGERALREWLMEADAEPSTARSVFMLKVFYGSHLPQAVLISLIDERRRRLEADRDRLLQIEREARAENDDADFFPLLTLRSGLLHARASIRWCNEVLAALGERKETP